MKGKATETTHQIGPSSLRASFVPSTLNEDRRTVDIVWTTGARVFRSGGFFSDPFYEELSLDPKHVRMERLESGRAPFLNAHNAVDANAVIGVIESARLEAKQGVATVRFAKAEDDAEADKIFRKVKDGILTNVSVGFQRHKAEQIESKDTELDTVRVIDWEPFEASILPMGADIDAVVRSSENLNPCVLLQRNQEEDNAMPKNNSGTATGTQAADGNAALARA